MEANIEIISQALAQAINGEPAPTFRSDDFAQILKASGHITGPSFDGTAKDEALAQIGLQAIKLIAARLVASMHSERAWR